MDGKKREGIPNGRGEPPKKKRREDADESRGHNLTPEGPVTPVGEASRITLELGRSSRQDQGATHTTGTIKMSLQKPGRPDQLNREINWTGRGKITGERFSLTPATKIAPGPLLSKLQTLQTDPLHDWENPSGREGDTPGDSEESAPFAPPTGLQKISCGGASATKIVNFLINCIETKAQDSTDDIANAVAVFEQEVKKLGRIYRKLDMTRRNIQTRLDESRDILQIIGQIREMFRERELRETAPLSQPDCRVDSEEDIDERVQRLHSLLENSRCCKHCPQEDGGDTAQEVKRCAHRPHSGFEIWGCKNPNIRRTTEEMESLGEPTYEQETEEDSDEIDIQDGRLEDP